MRKNAVEVSTKEEKRRSTKLLADQMRTGGQDQTGILAAGAILEKSNRARTQTEPGIKRNRADYSINRPVKTPAAAAFDTTLRPKRPDHSPSRRWTIDPKRPRGELCGSRLFPGIPRKVVARFCRQWTDRL